MSEAAPDLDALEQLASRATPGPWSEFCESGDWWIEQKDVEGSPTGLTVCEADSMSVDDMLFIVASRAAVPALIARVRALEAALSTIAALGDDERPTMVRFAVALVLAHAALQPPPAPGE